MSAIVELDDLLLTDLLRETGHDNLVFTAKDTASLKEFVEILHPFAEVKTR